MSNYNEYLQKALGYYFKDEEFIVHFGRVPKSRDVTFQYCLNHLQNMESNEKTILELGTSRSFTDGRFPGCNSDDSRYWEPNHPEKWDWSAGCFTHYFSELTDNKTKITTVDLMRNHINRCKLMTKNYEDKITYVIDSSEKVLANTPEKSVDLLYLDTGDMTPIEPTAQLHLREAKLVVERDVLKDSGIILIDDVRSCVPKKHEETSDYGKAKYSIPYFLDNGYEIVMDEYQVILRKK